MRQCGEILRQEWALMRFIAMDAQKKQVIRIPPQLWEQIQRDAEPSLHFFPYSAGAQQREMSNPLPGEVSGRTLQAQAAAGKLSLHCTQQPNGENRMFTLGERFCSLLMHQ